MELICKIVEKEKDMKYISYFFKGFAVFFIVLFLSTNIGYLIGPGTYGIGLVVCAISMLSAIVVVCTFVIVDAIKSNDN